MISGFLRPKKEREREIAKSSSDDFNYLKKVVALEDALKLQATFPVMIKVQIQK